MLETSNIAYANCPGGYMRHVNRTRNSTQSHVNNNNYATTTPTTTLQKFTFYNILYMFVDYLPSVVA